MTVPGTGSLGILAAHALLEIEESILSFEDDRDLLEAEDADTQDEQAECDLGEEGIVG